VGSSGFCTTSPFVGRTVGPTTSNFALFSQTSPEPISKDAKPDVVALWYVEHNITLLPTSRSGYQRPICISGDPHVIGRTLEINHVPCAIILVMPRSFRIQ
jgi:hypothetical protein